VVPAAAPPTGTTQKRQRSINAGRYLKTLADMACVYMINLLRFLGRNGKAKFSYNTHFVRFLH
jgi:hypothetical protein